MNSFYGLMFGMQIMLCLFGVLAICAIWLSDEWIFFENILEDIFILQVYIFDMLEDRVNSVGIVILMTLFTLVFWPCNILMTFTLAIVWLFSQIIKGFLYLFGKPDYDLGCCANCANFKWNLNKKCVCEPECKNAEIGYMEYSRNGLYVDLVKYCQNFKLKQK